MTRDEAVLRVLDYCYGEMSQKEAAEFEALLQADEALAREVEQVRSVRKAVSAVVQRPVLPEEVRRGLMFAARRRLAARREERRFLPEWLERFLLSPAFAGAMVVVVALGAGFHLVSRFGTESLLGEAERSEAVLLSRAANRVAAKEEGTGDTAVTQIAGAKEPPAPAGAKIAAPHQEVQRAASRKPVRTRVLESAPMASAPVARPLGPPSVQAQSRGRLDDAVGSGRMGGAGFAEAPTAAGEGEADHVVAAKARGDMDPLARARRLRAQGQDLAALSAYEEAIPRLKGDALRAALKEALELAESLGKKDIAARLRTRLNALEGAAPQEGQ